MNDLSPCEYKAILRSDLRLFRAALFLRAEPAGRVRDELAHRGHRRQADRGARGQDPAADHQPAAAPPQIACWPRSPFRPGVSGTTRRPRSSASAMPRISPTSSPAIAAAS